MPFLKFSPAYLALLPSSSSILSSWLYLAVRSDLNRIAKIEKIIFPSLAALLPAWRPGLDLTSAEPDHEVRYEDVLGFAGAVGDHGAPALRLGQLVRRDRLGHTSDLVNLQQQPIARLLLDGGGNALGVGDQEVVTHDLNSRLLGQLGVAVPVVLVKWILDGDYWIVLDEAL